MIAQREHRVLQTFDQISLIARIEIDHHSRPRSLNHAAKRWLQEETRGLLEPKPKRWPPDS